MKAINIFYEWWTTHLQAWLLDGHTWAIARIITNFVIVCGNSMHIESVQWILIVVWCFVLGNICLTQFC
jgi:hypothetical protein